MIQPVEAGYLWEVISTRAQSALCCTYTTPLWAIFRTPFLEFDIRPKQGSAVTRSVLRCTTATMGIARAIVSLLALLTLTNAQGMCRFTFLS